MPHGFLWVWNGNGFQLNLIFSACLRSINRNMGIEGKIHNWCVLNKLDDWFKLNEFNKFVWFYLKWTEKTCCSRWCGQLIQHTRCWPWWKYGSHWWVTSHEETSPARNSHQQIPPYDGAGLWLIKGSQVCPKIKLFNLFWIWDSVHIFFIINAQILSYWVREII